MGLSPFTAHQALGAKASRGPAQWGGVLATADEPCWLYCDYDPFRFAVVAAAAAGMAHWRKKSTPFVVGTGVVAALAAAVVVPVARIILHRF